MEKPEDPISAARGAREGSGRQSEPELPFSVATLESLSHELRTPLTTIIGYLDLVLAEEAGALTVLQRQYLQAAERNARRLARLANEIGALAERESQSAGENPD